MRETSTGTKAIRWGIFLLAAVYAGRMLVVHSLFDPPFGPFRWLTYWANIAALICAGWMLRRSYGRTATRADGLVAATSVAGAMVVYLYWSLYFADPLSVTTDGGGSWWSEGYYHAVGPALVWFDALFLLRGFRAPLRAAVWILGIVGSWLAFIELVVQPLSDTPIGSVTSGLPYPFLNNMPLSDRLPFYAMNIGAAFAMLAAFMALAWVIRRIVPTAP